MERYMQRWSKNMVKAKTETYETLYENLQKYIDELENGKLTLDESMKLYEEAIKIAEKCQEYLNKAQLQLDELEAVGEEK